ncbi:MAG TPA: hypothetical protein VII01_17470 [Solirubrobacteraceae bacterium]|jgi:hypothetical protein
MSSRSASLPSSAIAGAGIDIVRLGIAAFAAVDLATGLFMALAPHAFFKAIGPFDTFNPHYLRDVATFEGAFGIGLAIALYRPGWRVPMLAVSAAQYGLHSVNHLIDIDNTHPAWAGYADFVSLLAATITLLWLLRLASAEPSTPHSRFPRGGSQ